MIKGKTLEETQANIDKYLENKRNMRKYETLLDTAITVYTELYKASRLASIQLTRKGRCDEIQAIYRDRTVGAKATLGHLLRLRENHRRKRNGTEVSDWFTTIRRASLGTT